jgi:hypothetical protein
MSIDVVASLGESQNFALPQETTEREVRSGGASEHMVASWEPGRK